MTYAGRRFDDEVRVAPQAFDNFRQYLVNGERLNEDFVTERRAVGKRRRGRFGICGSRPASEFQRIVIITTAARAMIGLLNRVAFKIARDE